MFPKQRAGGATGCHRGQESTGAARPAGNATRGGWSIEKNAGGMIKPSRKRNNEPTGSESRTLSGSRSVPQPRLLPRSSPWWHSPAVVIQTLSSESSTTETATSGVTGTPWNASRLARTSLARPWTPSYGRTPRASPMSSRRAMGHGRLHFVRTLGQGLRSGARTSLRASSSVASRRTTRRGPFVRHARTLTGTQRRRSSVAQDQVGPTAAEQSVPRVQLGREDDSVGVPWLPSAGRHKRGHPGLLATVQLVCG